MSKKLWALFSLSLLFVTACGSASAPVPAPTEESKEVGPFVSKEGGFSINFPGEPTVSVEDTKADGGLTIKSTSYDYDLDETNSFSVIYTDFLIGDIAEKDARGLLKDEEGGALESFGLTAAEDESEMDYDEKNVGLRYRAKNSDGVHVVTQTYLVGSRLYQLEMFTMDNYPTDKEIDNFIGSFKLL